MDTGSAEKKGGKPKSTGKNAQKQMIKLVEKVEKRLHGPEFDKEGLSTGSGMKNF